MLPPLQSPVHRQTETCILYYRCCGCSAISLRAKRRNVTSLRGVADQLGDCDCCSAHFNTLCCIPTLTERPSSSRDDCQTQRSPSRPFFALFAVNLNGNHGYLERPCRRDPASKCQPSNHRCPLCSVDRQQAPTALFAGSCSTDPIANSILLCRSCTIFIFTLSLSFPVSSFGLHHDCPSSTAS